MKKEFGFQLANQIIFFITCPSCQKKIDLKEPFLDHHPNWCPICGVECVYLDWNCRKIQIVLQMAPPELVKFIRWLQENFDELEYIELIVSLEEIIETINQ